MCKAHLSKEKWYQQILRRFLSFEQVDISQLISSTTKKETGAGTTYLTSPINLFQKAMIYNAKIVDAIPPAIKLEEEEEQIVPIKARTAIIELSNHVRQLPGPPALFDHSDIQQEDDPKNLHLSNEENLEGCNHNSRNHTHNLGNRIHKSTNCSYDLGDYTHDSANCIRNLRNRINNSNGRREVISTRAAKHVENVNASK